MNRFLFVLPLYTFTVTDPAEWLNLLFHFDLHREIETSTIRRSQ